MPETKDPDGDAPEQPDEPKAKSPDGDAPEDRREMTPEDFARFLARLSTDPETAGQRYIRLQEKLLGFFRMKGISDVDGATNETIRRAAVLSGEGRSIPDMERFAFGVAKNVAREWRRREQREASTFHEFIRRLADNSDEMVERIQRLLEPCLDALPPEDRWLLKEYCRILRGRARAEHRRRLAERIGTTVLGLRMRVTRLRVVLTECVRKRIGSE